MTVKICLDAGHYGKYNQSPANRQYYESDMVWKLHLLLKEQLEKYGILVTTTRANKNTDLGVYNRGVASKGCDLFISLHSNAVGSYINDNVDYPVAIVLLNGTSSDIGLKLAKVVEKVMVTKQGARIATRRGSNGEYYGVLRGANAVGTPAIILEHSFHTNTTMTNWLLSDANLEKLASAEAECIAQHYGIKNKPVESVSKQVFKSYLVQVSISNLNIRKGPGINYSTIGRYTGKGVFTIVEEADGRGATKWGLLKSYANKRNGWISLDYAKKI